VPKKTNGFALNWLVYNKLRGEFKMVLIAVELRNRCRVLFNISQGWNLLLLWYCWRM